MPKRIFLIDDDNDLLEILEEVLVTAGFSVQQLTDSDQVLRQVKAEQPDLVVVDYLLPGINGGEICAQLKKDPQTGHIPVILMTAYPRVMLSLGNYGCDELIEKPFDMDYFLKRLEYYTDPVLTNNNK